MKLVGDENTNWDALLKIFHGIVEKNPKDAETQINSLRELAKAKNLTPRQAEGIDARCENYLNGTYGKTKTAANISQEHNFSSNGQQKH